MSFDQNTQSVRLSFLMLRLTRLYLKRLGDIAQEYQLSTDQILVLHFLGQTDDAFSIGKIAWQVPVQQPAVTKIVKKFENTGWVELVDGGNDRRVKKVKITADGHAKMGEIQNRLARNMLPFFGALDLEMKSNLAQVSERLIRVFGR